MAKISAQEIKRIYALGAGAGLLESGNKEDNLHALVLQLTGKESIKALTQKEFKIVEASLIHKMRGYRKLSSKKRTDSQPGIGMMSLGQREKAWALIYELCRLDTVESMATPGERMAGAIKKNLRIDVDVKDPFKWVDAQMGHKLIEQLKRYVASKEYELKRKEGT